MRASVPVGRCGPCVSITPIGNSTPAPRFTAASIATAVMSAMVSVNSAPIVIRSLPQSSRMRRTRVVDPRAPLDQQFVEYLIRGQHIAETLVHAGESDIVVLL